MILCCIGFCTLVLRETIVSIIYIFYGENKTELLILGIQLLLNCAGHHLLFPIKWNTSRELTLITPMRCYTPT